MNRVGSLFALVIVALLGPWFDSGTFAQSLPQGVPVGSQRATVTGFQDGDKVMVTLEGEDETVLMAGIDAPEIGECFYDESAMRLRQLIGEGTDVYLESSGEEADGKDRILRYVWLPREGKDALLINGKMVRDGYAVFDSQHQNPEHYDYIEESEQVAIERDRGLWGYCGGAHVDLQEAMEFRVDRAEPAPFWVAMSEDTSFGARERWVYRIVLDNPDSFTKEQIMAGILVAFENIKSEHPGVDAMTIFAYRGGTDVEGYYSLARSGTSTDGTGWDGNKGDFVNDEGSDKSRVWIEYQPNFNVELGIPEGDSETWSFPQLSEDQVE